MRTSAGTSLFQGLRLGFPVLLSASSSCLSSCDCQMVTAAPPGTTSPSRQKHQEQCRRALLSGKQELSRTAAPSRIPFMFCVTWPPPALRKRAEWMWAFQLLLPRWRRNEKWVLAWPECCLPRDLQSSVFAPRVPMRSESKGNSETEKHFVKGCCAVCYISSFHPCPALQSCSL